MIKIAQVGCGYWGKNLTRNFAELGYLNAVVDGHPETAQSMSEQYNARVMTFDEVLADGSIDGVSFATPAPLHAEQAIAAIESGKHVYIEKPMAMNVAEAEKIIAAGEKHNKVVMVGHLLQYHPIFMQLLHEVQNGRIGELQYVYSNRLSLGKFRIEENVLWSFSPHDISMILSIANSPVKTVSAQSAAVHTKDIADVVTAQIEFESGVKSHLFASWMHPFKEQKLTVIGSEGALVFEDSLADWDKKLAFYDHKIDLVNGVPTPTKADIEYIEVAKGEPLKNECQHFADCITEQTPARTDGQEGMRVLNVLELAEAALKDN